MGRRTISVLCLGLAWMMPDVATAQTEQVYYYHTDAAGSVRMITDANGQEVTRYDFWPFGQVSGAPAVQDSRMFAGEEHDAESQSDYLGARYYQGQTGRFTTPDDPSYMDPANPQSLNRYAYANNNPLRWVDPTGHTPCPPPTDTSTCVEGTAPDQGLIQWLVNSLFRPLDTAAQQVVQPVTDWLTATRDPACLSGWVGKGASVGGVAGGIVGAVGGGTGGAVGGTFVAPLVGTLGGGFAGGTGGFVQGSAAGILGGSVLGGAVGSVACMSSGGGGGGGGNGPREKTRGANRGDRKMVDDVARRFGLNRRAFGEYVESYKRSTGMGGSENFTWDELVERAHEFAAGAR